MSVWQLFTWDMVRAGGLTAYLLLTLAVALGLALSMQIQSPSKWPRLVNNELHNFLTLLALVFVGIHMLASWLDPFTRFGLNEILIPLVSHYRPAWMALGIIAFYLGLAIGISTLIRPIIGYPWWRRLHVFTLLIFALVTVHGIATGSDTRTWWGLFIYIFSVTLVGGLLIRRLLVPVTARGRAHPVLASATVLALLVGFFWVVLGPLQSGWNAIAGGSATTTGATQSVPQAHASQGSQPSQNNQSSDPFASSFTADLQGKLTQDSASANGTSAFRMDTTLSNGAQGSMVIVLQGQQGSDSEGGPNITSTQVTLGTSANSPLYQGYLTNFAGESRLRMVALLTKTGGGKQTSEPQIQLRIEMRVNSSNQLSGVVQGTPVSTNIPGSPATPGTLGDDDDEQDGTNNTSQTSIIRPQGVRYEI